MKITFVAVILLTTHVALAGQFVQRSLYSSTNLAVGNGSSLQEAIADAKSAIPTGDKRSFYEPDSNFNSPAYQCLDGSVWTEKTECSGTAIQYVIPLRHVSR